MTVLYESKDAKKYAIIKQVNSLIQSTAKLK